MWKDTSPAGGEEQLRRPGCGLGLVRATLQCLQPSLLGPERLGTTRASAMPWTGPSVMATPLMSNERRRSTRSHSGATRSRWMPWARRIGSHRWGAACVGSAIDKLQPKRTEPFRNHPGAGGSCGRSAKCDFIVLGKLHAKRTEPSQNHPGAIGSRGRSATCVGGATDELQAKRVEPSRIHTGKGGSRW